MQACETCARSKPRNFREQGCVRPLPLARQAFQDIEIDFIPELPASGENAATRIATIVDRHSGVAIFIACHDTITAKDFAKLFVQHYYRRFGLPRTHLSDNDTILTAEYYAEVLRLLDIDASTGAPFNKRTTGKAERTNQTIESILRAFVKEDKDWADWLPVAEFIYNTTPSQVTGISPFETIFGDNPPRGHVVDHLPRSPTAADEIPRKLREIRNFVTSKLLENQVTLQARGPQEELPSYQVGEWVWLDNKHSRSERDKRLKPRWEGPFPIQARLNEVTYELELPDSARIKNVIHASRLKRCHRPRLPTERDARTGEEHIVYEVDKILDHVMKGRGRKAKLAGVKVSFRGYDSSYDLWMPVEEMKDARELLQRYAKKHGLTIGDERS